MSASITNTLPISNEILEPVIQEKASVKKEEIPESLLTKLSSSVIDLYSKYHGLIERKGTQFASYCRSGTTSLSKFILFPLKISACGQKIQNAIANELGFLVEKVILLFTHLIKDLPTIAVIVGMASLLAFCVQASSSLFIAGIFTAIYLAYKFFENKFNQQEYKSNSIIDCVGSLTDISQQLCESAKINTECNKDHFEITRSTIKSIELTWQATLGILGVFGLMLHGEIRPLLYKSTLPNVAFVDGTCVAVFSGMLVIGFGTMLGRMSVDKKLKILN